MNEINERNSKYLASMRWGLVLWIVLLFCLGMKPIHLDEANFLMLTQGDWWAPHSVMVNWEGVRESAFDVLSNPPGMAWWLWPVKDQSVLVMRLWVLPWSLLFLWGLSRLIQIFGLSFDIVIVMLVSPFFALSHNSLMPEMPLLACIVCGWQGILSRRHLVLWSLVLGFASWFRYSGLSMVPLLIFWVLWHRPNKGFLAVFACMFPTIVLMIHDVIVYGGWHFLHMISFQQEQQSWDSVFHKLGALLAMLGGGFAIPWGRFNSRTEIRNVGTVSLVLVGVLHWMLQDISIWSGLWIWFGGVLLLQSMYLGVHRQNWWLLLWILGGVVFLLSLRFAATRYWGPFVIPILLVLGKDVAVSRWWIMGWAFISVHVTWDDAQLSKAHEVLAEQVNEQCDLEQKYFAGHWGWQYALERYGWDAVEDDSIIPNSVCYSFAHRSWPQNIENTCWEEEYIIVREYENILFPIRVHTMDGQSNYHSFMISNVPPFPTYAPWGIGWDYWDQASLRMACRF